MASFLESKPTLTAYLRRMSGDRLLESWKQHIEDKTALQFISTRSLWTVEMNYVNGSMFFTLEIGFMKNGGPRWKALKELVVVNMIVLNEVILIDVVNSSNGEDGVILIRVEDEMTFCYDRMVKNYEHVPHLFQVLMMEIKSRCEAYGGSFVQTARAVKTYLSDGNKIHNAALTAGIISQETGTSSMDGEGRAQKKKKTVASTLGASNRARPPALSALPGASSMAAAAAIASSSTAVGATAAVSSSAAPVAAPAVVPSSAIPVASPAAVPRSATTAATPAAAPSATPVSTTTKPQARPKMRTKKRKPAGGAGVGPSCRDVPVKRSRQQPQSSDAGHSEAAPTLSEQSDIPEPAEVSEEEAKKQAIRKVNGHWLENPVTVPHDTLSVPDKLFVEVEIKKGPRRSEAQEAKIRRQAEAMANRKFKELANYMYIFGRGKYFELEVDDMQPCDEQSGMIYRPLEDKGVALVQDRMVKMNFTKQILTVMPDTPVRPTCWRDCLAAFPLKIINGQHTWKASKEILSGEANVDDKDLKKKVQNWICEVVWTKNTNHLHALSCKCNDGNVDSPFQSSIPATIKHCRYLWINAHRPPHFRKNLRKTEQSESSKRYEVSI